MIEQITRRKLIGGLGLLIAAPAIVRVTSLMPVKAFDDGIWFQVNWGSPKIVGQIMINGNAIITRVEVSNDLINWIELPTFHTLDRVGAGDLIAGRYHRLHFYDEVMIDSMEMLET